ncbi:TetR/AcrR family transcriptional regulator [Cryptosporangium aurantiacum]|uniref:Transcriptional regulator, TetR family n=1 Tax=Cryptosporangium aurantiacum TaxID=134849 RepID=A0A1M7RMB8_9ACTN|nr:TetR/AcrR family transcriptional regulator [Cryptosporangium aurantiacum]SHN47339.1 transcriptional regulator, TetR family [Cryptosporangium aurantiacum]
MSERMTTTRRRHRPTKSGTVLSQDLIVQTAIRLVREHGAEGLSVRRLGAALGADPSAIYRYFRNTDDLVRAVADDLIGKYLSDFTPGPDWRQTLRELGLRIHSASVAQPRTAVLTASRVTGRPHEIRVVELGLGVLRSAGFAPDDAARHYHAFIDLTLGFAALDAAAFALPRGTEDADDAVWTDVYARLSPDTHPHIASAATALAETMRGSAYPAALDLLLDGLAQRLGSDR